MASTYKTDAKFIKRIESAGGEDLKKCYQCATCSAVCKLTPEDRPFPRKEMMYAQWGLEDKLAADPDIWLCHQCNDCNVKCPRGARPGDVMAAARNHAFEHYAFPPFMGKLLARPSGLPILFIIPIIIVALLADWSKITEFTGHVHFTEFVKNGLIEGLWMAGNIMIFAFAAVGLHRFYKAMVREGGIKPKIGFMTALFRTISDIINHNRFGRCDAAKYRRAAHLLVFYGFIGAMATAGLALARMEYLHLIHPAHYPLDAIPSMAMYHPIKILGNVSGLALLAGLAIVIVIRARDPEAGGAMRYSYTLFYVVLLGVAFTGMIIQFLRMGELPMLAYGTYYVHLVLVFFLLWYAPYSHFGHMFYRTLGMTYAKSIGREPQKLR